MYYGTYTCLTEHILILRVLYLHYGICTCLTDLILVLQNIFLYFGSYSELILVQSTRRYYTDSLYGGTRRYHWTYTYFTGTGVPVGTTGLILILPIREYS